MDRIPVAFVDSVAHALSDDNLLHLCFVNFWRTCEKHSRKCDLWRKVGERHYKKRKNYELKVVVNDEALSVEVQGELAEDSKHSTLTEFSKLINPFTRISRVTMFTNFEGFEELACQKTQLQRVLELFQNQTIDEIYVSKFFELSNFSFTRFLWKRPVHDIGFSSLSFTDEFVAYHILENESLKQVFVTDTTYTFMCKLIKSWKDELKLEFCSERDSEGKSFSDLRDLGFEKTDSLSVSRCSVVRKSGRSLKFYAFK
ncbi:hypothetical protein L596_009901 [Steinernema carpocapsae]|uniref:Uncharacterized protein n=1 Tax=Steinernema carpocapsae TaxID=34508 RepID=A0A4U5PGN9_STECR|nr:hypothetical protein L596_009901 [Steinernema carpocapsae]